MNESTHHEGYRYPADLNMLKGVAENRNAKRIAVEETDKLLSCVNTYGRPSDLKITDLRVTSIAGAPMPCSIIRIDTNQGIYGYGEVRDHAAPEYVLMLKRHLIGENPCNIDKLFRRVKQFGAHGRQAGGVCAVEIALWDIAGKAYGIPVYQMLGGKFRDKVRLYCDTHPDGENTGDTMGDALNEKIDEGYTFLKMNLSLSLLVETPGTISAPLGLLDEFLLTARSAEACKASGDMEGTLFWRKRNYDINAMQGPLTGIHYTEKGLDLLEEYVRRVREKIGYEIPLAMDNFGHVGFEDCVRIARRLEKYNPAWLEDMLPWHYTQLYERLANMTYAPLATGEDIYLCKGFEPLLQKRAIAVAHTDLLSCGGILENKRIGDMAQEYGVAMAVHMAESPVACMAAVQSVAATENLLAMEFHSSEVPWWSDLVEDGVQKPIIENGCIAVPDLPGIGIGKLNDEVLREHLNPNFPVLWASTEQWDHWYSRDRQWS